MAKIFISYKRNVRPDTIVATKVYEALSQDHQVFIDTTIQVGEKWAERIQNEIKQSDYLIIFLSENSVQSEMVIAEIETAYHHAKQYHKPMILPVRLAYREPLVYPISAYLNSLQWALWDQDSDTQRLVNELQRAVSGGSLPSKLIDKKTIDLADETPTAFAAIPLRDLVSPEEGTMPVQSRFYVERETDSDALNVLLNGKGTTITIKGPRQMGKSSLLNRLVINGRSHDMRAAFIDFQLIEKNSISNADIFYRRFCSLISWELEIEDHTEEFWKLPLGPLQRTTNYIARHVLANLQNKQLLLAMDEVDCMFISPFRSDFFAMLRGWHNKRSENGEWTRFNMVLVTSTEPYQFILELNQSPFNVGAVVEMKDFTPGQVNELNQRYQKPLTPEQVIKISELLGGQPYLTRKAFYLAASGQVSFEYILKNASEDQGPFGDHLRNYLFRMSEYPELKAGLVEIMKYHHCTDEHIFFRLRGAGLVKRIGKDVLPRNSLYAEYFMKRLA